MRFEEVIRYPEFALKMSVEEVYALWKIVNSAADNGNRDAEAFVETLSSHIKEWSE